jgi:hypothetical protein
MEGNLDRLWLLEGVGRGVSKFFSNSFLYQYYHFFNIEFVTLQ